MRHRSAYCLLVLLIAPLLAFATGSVPFWGARASSPADTPLASLKHGEWVWIGDAVKSGPIVITVSLSEQRGYVYRNGILIGATTVSTGRPHYETPTGVFTILQKDVNHRSTIYDSAPMPYMERLTWGGVALHAGGLPGYPESHGCVHLPSEFARLLYAITTTGITVVIASDTTQPREVVHPGYLAPVSFKGGTPIPVATLTATETMRWEPQLATEGPISIVLSRSSGRAIVVRDGIEIGRSRVIFNGSEPIGTHALVLVDGPASLSTRFLPDPKRQHWIHIGIAGRMGEEGTEPNPAIADRIEIPPEFERAVFGVLATGTTVLLTDEAITPVSTGGKIDVIDADPPDTPPR